MKSPLLTIVLIFHGIPCLFAQASPLTSSQKPTASFRIMALDCSPEGLLYQFGSNNVPLVFREGCRSLPLSYGAGDPLVLFRQVTGADGKMTNQPVLTLDLSSYGSLPLVVFHKPTAPSLPPAVTIYREDGQAFPSGTVRILNEGKIPLEARFGEKEFAVPAGGFKDLSASGEVFTVGISSVIGGKKELLFNSNVGLVPANRVLFLAGPSAGSSLQTVVRKLLDAPPPR